ncbi:MULTISPECIES: SDR family NAD(P)-dependent oxidoreductase [Achromobacter]|jgi:NAD(P)-dependent dehydrogenase (short-subunit alcohol dehydrogenase family)|uniref:SDR family NAD(P)-dependent oxidoreductase n=1 Tax=Achromobacter aegrifaciens TaxID=1287736 RepID=A0ABU2DIH7_ACHAE|nr:MULTISPECIES: SDR family NAD(P)-dependent oxidoreductase [Achromobacter]MBD9433442.1 SDR family NAD(P)-dependent oxidoreductase [Achromobacter sp. ACM03]MDQ1763698.1 SDR family NAD(P)-dependent oxidoreductase [Achromobacter aegrifaciens]MDR7947922.1 SDR family NAD(P)-dependent oxidoreductase [Achromobacter aegrifaciens]CAB3896866.1 Putative short-chain type dehydrogenase/reductase [Achromobacter aegrifaciens]
MTQLLQGRVAIVTGAGRGLGRSHALELAQHGAKVLVNDLGADRPDSPAQAVVDAIRAAGGDAMAHGADVTQPQQAEAMVQAAIANWGRVDILVNNAGILRDKTFAKMSLEDFRLVIEVHLMGAVHCTQAVWNAMREQNYGRIVMTTSSSGLYGNFGQANYGAAKMALVGLMQTLALEGERYGVRVNCLAPTAATAMTEGLLDEQALALLTPDSVSPALVALVAENAPTRTILMAGAGSFEQANITMTRGIHLSGEELSAQALIGRLDEVSDRAQETVPATGFDQLRHEIAKALACETEKL